MGHIHLSLPFLEELLQLPERVSIQTVFHSPDSDEVVIRVQGMGFDIPSGSPIPRIRAEVEMGQTTTITYLESE